MMDSNRFLSFSLGQESFAIPLLKVKEVIGVPKVTPLPQTPSYFLGMMNLRGQIISILDLRSKFNIKATDKKDAAVIICDLGEQNIGVVVDSIDAVLAPEANQISQPPTIHSNIGSEYIEGVFKSKDRLTLLVNISKILSPSDHKILSKKAA